MKPHPPLTLDAHQRYKQNDVPPFDNLKDHHCHKPCSKQAVPTFAKYSTWQWMDTNSLRMLGNATATERCFYEEGYTQIYKITPAQRHTPMVSMLSLLLYCKRALKSLTYSGWKSAPGPAPTFLSTAQTVRYIHKYVTQNTARNSVPLTVLLRSSVAVSLIHVPRHALRLFRRGRKENYDKHGDCHWPTQQSKSANCHPSLSVRPTLCSTGTNRSLQLPNKHNCLSQLLSTGN